MDSAWFARHLDRAFCREDCVHISGLEVEGRHPRALMESALLLLQQVIGLQVPAPIRLGRRVQRPDNERILIRPYYTRLCRPELVLLLSNSYNSHILFSRHGRKLMRAVQQQRSQIQSPRLVMPECRCFSSLIGTVASERETGSSIMNSRKRNTVTNCESS